MTKPKFNPERLYELDGAAMNKLWEIAHQLYCDGGLPARVRDQGIICCHTLERAKDATASDIAAYENWIADN
jgi:hypothetical protein